ncbi:ATP-dependent helicase HrpB, partial [Microbacterium sp. ISL-103]|uniref:ATP-dependent helicase C-terminal domain-containing protein n=1 Tax=Microbacterium sp. ISL-103 TaxID=2819156 RepID=UPI001C14DBA7
ARGMTGLVTTAASRSSSVQRAGRATRQGPGAVIRCVDERTYAAAPARPVPEIAVTDLADAALLLACWGSPGGVGLRMIDPLPADNLADAVTVLRGLGAIDGEGRATAEGRALAHVPTDPRLARALRDGSPVVGSRLAAEVVAVLGGDLRVTDADVAQTLIALRGGRTPDSRRWRDDANRLERLVRATPGVRSDLDGVGLVIALAFPDRIAHRVERTADGATFLLASGTRAGVRGALAAVEWIAVADVARASARAAAGSGAVIRSAAVLTETQLEHAASHLMSDRVEAEFVGGRVQARRERRIGAILRSSAPVRASARDGRDAVGRALRRDGIGMFTWSEPADALRRRVALLRRELGDLWPDVSDAGLVESLDAWLAPELDALAGGTPAGRLNLTPALRRLLPWPDAARLDELAPERLEVPSGSRIRIDYPAPDDDPTTRPVVAVKLQECFGWAQTPRLVDGRVPVLFHLLSPAGRPLAVTDDLASFWSGPYAQVRAEMRGRYPRHPWPEDPWAAAPTKHTKNRAAR